MQRVLGGMAVDTLSIKVNGDFHEFDFNGQAQDLVDTASFESGEFALSAYPAEPSVAPISYSIIPGNLGQVWLGSSPTRFFTITNAECHLYKQLGAAGSRIRRDSAQRHFAWTTNGVDQL